MLQVTPVRAFSDNYIWLIRAPADAGAAIVVDPGDDGPVELALQAAGLRLAAILVTHHHGDHVGGVDALRPRLQGPVYAPAGERMPEPVQRLHGGDSVQLLGLRFAVLDVPGHTAGHIAYFHCAEVDGAPLLFCGDTLFSLGCGRMFEGTPTQMLASLDRLAALPGDTWVCCGHEYTEANGRFARTVEPDNPARESHLADVARRRARGEPSLPSSLAQERAGNPFLRLDAPGVHASLTARLGRPPRDRVEAFAVLRAWKDGFTA